MSFSERYDQEISHEQLKEILREDMVHFPEILDNVFCGNCMCTTIDDYKIYICPRNDVILKGVCKKCRGPVARVMETGEDPKKAKRAEKIYKQLRGRK